MVKAVFQKKVPYRYLVLCCGLFLVGLFVFLGSTDSEVTFNDVLPGIILGGVFCSFGIFSLFLNFKAFLYMDNGYIKGKYHLFGKIDCCISEVGYVSAQFNTLTIQLNNGRVHTIAGIENSWELCSYIRQNMPFNVTAKPEKLIKDLNNLKSAKQKGLIYVCSGIAVMFINIFITVFLTGERKLHEFSKTDWTIMAVMGIIEIVTIIATFYIAQKTGKNNIPIEKLRYEIQRRIIETKPLLPGNVIKVFADENYIGRITVFGYPNEDSVYYTLQEIASDYSFIKVYESEIYEDIEQLSNEFGGLIDITEKVLH